MNGGGNQEAGMGSIGDRQKETGPVVVLLLTWTEPGEEGGVRDVGYTVGWTHYRRMEREMEGHNNTGARQSETTPERPAVTSVPSSANMRHEQPLRSH